MEGKPNKRLQAWQRAVDLVVRMAEVDRLLNGLIASVRLKAAGTLTSIGMLLGALGWVL